MLRTFQMALVNDENIAICSKLKNTPYKAIKKKLSDYSPGVNSRDEKKIRKLMSL